MSAVWLIVLVVGRGDGSRSRRRGLCCSAAGSLPDRVASVVALLAPVLLAALVVTQTVGGDNELVLDSRLAGVGAGAAAIALRAPLPVVVIVAAAATALVRALV